MLQPLLPSILGMPGSAASLIWEGRWRPLLSRQLAATQELFAAVQQTGQLAMTAEQQAAFIAANAARESTDSGLGVSSSAADSGCTTSAPERQRDGFWWALVLCPADADTSTFNLHLRPRCRFIICQRRRRWLSRWRASRRQEGTSGTNCQKSGPRTVVLGEEQWRRKRVGWPGRHLCEQRKG